ncbi:MAG: hypothetical protein HZB59_07010 [Ignavibacteriales bacterium]|nr:hypothetical protein [Ignavibacteriales bacterium]
MKLPIIAYIYLSSTIAVFVLGALRFRRFDRGMIFFFCFIIVIMIIEVITYTLMILSINNHWVLHIYDLLEYIFLMLMFANWQSDKKIGSTLELTIPVFAVAWLISKFTIESFSGLSNYIHPSACLIIIIVSILTLFQSFRINSTTSSIRSRIWIISGILIYYSGSIVYYSLVNQFAAMNYSDALVIMYVHWSLDTFTNVIYSAGILMVKR